MKLLFETGAGQWQVDCNWQAAPRTLAALARTLPQSLQLHTPKIAGSHIYWHAPFVEDVEGAVHVLDARPGAFVYWPVRQFLEITFAPLQAETASVTVLGHLDGPVDGIVALGARLCENHGTQPFPAKLSLLSGGASVPALSASAVPADIVSGRRQLWQACPQDVAALRASRAIMHPVGPVMVAESEARVLHETLWWIRERLATENETVLRRTAAIVLNKAAVRLRDFCHMTGSAALLFRLESATGIEAVPLEELIEEAILIAGRLSAWIDLLIPWNDLNESFHAALDGAKAAPDLAASPC